MAATLARAAFSSQGSFADPFEYGSYRAITSTAPQTVSCCGQRKKRTPLHLRLRPPAQALPSGRMQSGTHTLRRRFSVKCGLVQKVTAKELDSLLSERALPLVVDFYATWCGPCVLLAQELEQLAVEYHGQIQFLKVDTDEEYELAQQLQIRGLPTVVFVSQDKSKPALRTEGLLPSATIKELLAEL